ncbi:IS110 family transposase [Bailinhaonella thermotolerans]|uniref:IS110 family transposase n=1 Tax=Bailinhaonella thermotolerans TaxID=1070861 RepID=A0A3A4A612_9ACTN|nr:IS110 family transposase [Bailinhaonella thermotolerans]RJL21037.1 IS110 family transposase [Bailinhaonella thermotolerans]
MARWWMGIDWAEGLHDVAVVDEDGQVVARARIRETPEGVKELLALLSGLSTSKRHSRRQVPIAIETSRILLVHALRQAGLQVVAINPMVVARYRGRVSPARRRKSDRGDAELLANIIRVDAHLHRPLPRPGLQAQVVTELSRAQRHAVREQHRQLGRLRSLVRLYYPAALSAFDGRSGLLRPEARALLAAAPTPRAGARLRHRQIADLLVAAGRTRLIDEQAARIGERLRTPQLRRAPEIEAAMGEAMLATLALTTQACAQVEQLTAQMTSAFEAHPHAPLYRSMPGVGPVIGARLLGEIGDDLDRFASARSLRAYAGAAPLTWASGSTRTVRARRFALNGLLRESGHHWAFASLTRSVGARAYYDRRREAGDGFAAALRRLAGRLLTCLYGCLRTGVCYREEIAFPSIAAA